MAEAGSTQGARRGGGPVPRGRPSRQHEAMRCQIRWQPRAQGRQGSRQRAHRQSKAKEAAAAPVDPAASPTLGVACLPGAALEPWPGRSP